MENIICGYCQGSGKFIITSMEICSFCNCTGYSRNRLCSMCSGSGKRFISEKSKFDCRMCDGVGKRIIASRL